MEKELKPFDKVLVRSSFIGQKGYWLPALYGGKIKGRKFITSVGWQDECIPYEGNEEYLGTIKDYVEPAEKNKAIKSDEDSARESLLDWLKMKRNNTMIPFSLREADRWIAWLEKQGESTEINPSEFDLRLNKLLKRFELLPKEEIAGILSFYLNVVRNDGTYKEEKQGEQKPVDKVEPKFKVGDVIKRGMLTLIVGSINFKKEFYELFKDNKVIYCLPFVEQDGWELVANNTTENPKHCVMADSSYCPYFKKQKPANWLQELEDKLANATPQQLAEWKEKYFKEEPAEWSEEDEAVINRILAICSDFVKLYEVSPSSTKVVQKDVDEIEAWLKSLKDRYTWKPSEEQMIALKCAITTADEKWVCMNTKDLESLYEDLRKLKD